MSRSLWPVIEGRGWSRIEWRDVRLASLPDRNRRAEDRFEDARGWNLSRGLEV